jgi:hypothetical protein
MIFFSYHKQKQKIKKIAWQHFATQSSFWVKINLDPMVRWRELNKVNVHIVYNLQFLNNHRASCLWFIKHYQTKENKNKIQCSFVKSPLLWYGSDFFLKKIKLGIYCSKMKNTHIFWMKFDQKKLYL